MNERIPAYALNDKVTTVVLGMTLIGQVVAVKPPDREHVTHRYRVATNTGTELWLEEPCLQRAPTQESAA